MEISRKKLRFAGIAFAVVTCLALGAWFFGRPAYRRVREARALEMARQAEAAKDYGNAMVAARKALMFNPTNLEACLIMARMADLSGSPQVVDWRKRIAELAPSTENQLWLASSAMRVRNPSYALAAHVLDGLAPSATNLPAFHVTAAELALRTGRLDNAAQHFQQAIALEPTNETHRLNLAVLRLQSTNQALVKEARANLQALTRGTNTAAAALRWLVTDELRQTNYARAEALSSELLQRPEATFEDQLQHLTVLNLAGAPGLNDQLANLKQTSATNAAQVYAIAGWMVSRDRADEALKWLSSIPRKVREEPPAPFGFVDCYVALKDWPGLEGYLQNEKWGEREFMRLAYLSRASYEQKHVVAAETRWRGAVYAAGDRLGALTSLLGMASSWGRATAREEMLWQIAQRFPRERWALLELDKQYQAAADTRGLNKLYSMLAAIDPANLSVQNNLATTFMLLNQNLPKAYELAKNIYDREPNNPNFASTYAFSLHQQGRSREALGVLERFPTNALEQPQLALYYGIILAANGDANGAARLLNLARTSRLLPEEEALLARAKK